MKLSRKAVTKLASLSALGVGVVIVGAEDADASITYNPVQAKVGFDTGFNAAFSTVFSGANGFNFKTGNATTQTTARGFRKISFRGLGAVQFGVTAIFSRLRLFTAANTLGADPLRAGPGLVASRYWSSPRSGSARHLSTGIGSFASQEYALFDFACPTSGTCYGWVGLSSLVITQPAYGPAGGTGPDLTIDGYAYDTTPGQKLPAGDQGTATPEPDTFALMGLAALALGAVGVRQWRAARLARQAA